MEKFVHPSDRHFHGIDGFCDFPFPADPVDDPDNPVIRADEPAAVAMAKLVQKFPGNFWIFIFNGTAHFKNWKQLFEYQHLLLLRNIWAQCYKTFLSVIYEFSY